MRFFQSSSSCAAAICAILACAGTHAQQGLPVMDGKRGQAQPAAKQGPLPLSMTYGVKLDVVPGASLGEINNDAFWLADQAGVQEGGVKRVSVEMPLAFDWNAGQWHDVPLGAGGGRLWVLDIVSPNAWGVRPFIEACDLPPGVQLTVYAPNDLESAPWPYEGKGRFNTGEFWARTAFGNTARVEMYVPPSVKIDEAKPLFKIPKVHHWYINITTGTPSAFATNELGCHRDVNCESWGNEEAGVCMLYFNGGLCTGSILNTFASDWTPYLYTAAHCFNTQATADALETYWFYESASCDAGAPASWPSGANRADDGTLLSTGTPADHTFVMIEGAIRRDLWWEGWDPNAFGTGNAAFGIHHPGGTYKRFSSGTTSTTGVGCSISGIGAGVTGLWSVGTTEPGSSGSPLFDSSRRVRGALSCANATCTGGSRRFYYGPFASAYPNFSALLNGGSDDGYDGAGQGDSCATAPQLTTGAGSGSVTNLIVKSVDQDYYSFVVPAFGSFTASVNFTHAWGDIDMALEDACTGTVLTSSGGTSNSETVTWSNAGGTARTVTLRVYLYNDTRNTYNLSYNSQAPAAPSNNTCSTATSLSNATPVAGSNIGATADSTSSCAGSNSDVWYYFFAPCSNTLTISTAGSNFDTVLSVHSTCPSSSGTELACNDDFNDTLQSQVNFPVTANTGYYIRVASFGGRPQGNISIVATLDRFWSNDDCPNSFGPLGPGSYTFDNCGSTVDGPRELLCGSFAGTVFQADFWNDIVAPSNGTFTIDTNGSSIDTMLAAYTSCPSGPDQAIACNDDAFPPQRWSLITFAATGGSTYKLRTGGYLGARGPGNLNITFTPDVVPCDSIDFNNDGLFPDDTDLVDFLSVLAGGPCSNDPFCSDIDFNNDGLFPDDADLVAFLTVLAGGDC